MQTLDIPSDLFFLNRNYVVREGSILKEVKILGHWRTLHNECVHDFNSLDVITLMKSKRISKT
jgi:hypothetical protein